MSYITTDNLTNIMAEMTDYCNAACPMCNRFDWGLNLIKGVNAHHTTLEFVKQRIGDEMISIKMCSTATSRNDVNLLTRDLPKGV